MTGPLLGMYLILSLVAFAIADLGLWLSGRQTWSQWVIIKKNESRGWKIAAWAFILGIVLVMLWLIPHWELV